MTARRAVSLRYRLDVTARLVAGLAGGYAVASLVAIAAAWALPIEPVEAATAGTIAALVALPIVVMGCFWARTPARAWGGTLLAAVILSGIALAGGWRP